MADERDQRFEELLSRLPDGELSPDELTELVQRARGNPAREQEIQDQLEAAEMIALSEDDLRDSGLFVSALQARIGDDAFVAKVRTRMLFEPRPSSRRPVMPWAIATGLGVALLVTGAMLLLSSPPFIEVELTDAVGRIQWTSEDGQVEDVREGDRLVLSGTLDQRGPGAWTRSRFQDGTTATLFGQASMTLTGDPQKVLHLRRGNMSANVSAQPEGRPLVIRTQTARLHVLGTRFQVLTDSHETKLRVQEGRVQIERLTDGSVVEVPAAQWVVVSIDDGDELRVRREEPPVFSWQARLQEEADYGEWVHADPAVQPQDHDGVLRVAPMRSRDSSGLQFVASLVPGRRGASPVALSDESTFRVRGRVQQPADLIVGVSLGESSGDILGQYRTSAMKVQGEFDIFVPLVEFEAVGDSLSGIELVSWFGVTNARDAELEFTSVELLEAAPTLVIHEPPSPLLSPTPPRPTSDIEKATNFRIGGDVQPPSKTKNVYPTYPSEAITEGVEGSVKLEAVIGVDGRVTDVQVLESVPLLDAAAVAAVRQWEYVPTLLNGVPVPVIVTVVVNYSFDGDLHDSGRWRGAIILVTLAGKP